MKTWIVLVALLLGSAPSFAQSEATPGTSPDMGPPAGITAKPGSENTTVSVANSTSARLALADAGFTDILSLKPGPDGWVADAIRDGKRHEVRIDEEDGSVQLVK